MEKETSEIVKLTERISKDPKSKLFVPLAEEYKKTGDLEMAVHVLTEGLKNNPGYVTARSILGRLLLDQGDLTGSQKELEEVVKVIPDNLLAQRKLGDICILQSKPNEALKYYKLALSLNPRDEEITSLISDIEAGRDVLPKIHQPKAKPSSEQAVKPAERPKPQSGPAQPAPEKRVSTLATAQPEAPKVEIKPDLLTPTAAPVQQEEPEEEVQPEKTEPHAAAEKIEEPEEIFIVEPLEDQEKQKEEPHAAGLDFLSGQSPTGEVVVEPQKEKFRSAVEKPVKAEAGKAEIKKSATPARVKEVEQEPSLGKSDDFTTDTLAELYIAQGFYEKAIDIYERMFVDNPTSRGLKDKLERVRAMAAAAEPSADSEVEATPVDVFAEPQLYSAQEEPASEKKPERFPDPPMPAAAVKSQEWPAAGSVEQGDLSATPEGSRSQPAFSDFEPREYSPPQAGQEAEPVEMQAKTTGAATKSSRAIRKETIDRLESWLKNIKKEK